MSSGGGGQSGQTRYDWNDVIGSYWGGAPGADGKGGGGVLGWAFDEATRPYQQYGAPRIAARNTDQFTAAQNVRNLASTGGPAETQTGRAAAQQFAANGGVNTYSGNNPYFQQMVRNANQDTEEAYKNGTSAELTRLMNMSGAFGGSAHLNAMANNQAGLAKQLGNQTTSMYGQQYDRSANLDESRLGRQMNAIPLTYQAQGLSTDLNNQLMGIGQWDQAENQKYLDQNYNDWATGNNWNRNNVNWLASLLGGAQGSTGIQTQFGGYQPPNYGSTAAGLGLLGASLFGGK
jgi:hypothetical protein